VSSYEIDSLRIRFTNSFLVSSVSDGSKLIPNWKTNYHPIPPQIQPYSALDAAGAILSNTMNVLLYGSIAFNVLANTSLQLVWSMINTLQLIVHLPLFSVVHPSNALYFYTLLMGVANVFILEEIFSKMLPNCVWGKC